MTEWFLIGVPVIESVVTMLLILFAADIKSANSDDIRAVIVILLSYWIPVIGTTIFACLIIKLIKSYE